VPKDRLPTARNVIKTGQTRFPPQSKPVRVSHKHQGEK
jgi:hypothetical protein